MDVEVNVVATYTASVEATYGDTEDDLKRRAEEQVRDRLVFPDGVASTVVRTPELEAARLAVQEEIPKHEALASVSAPADAAPKNEPADELEHARTGEWHPSELDGASEERLAQVKKASPEQYERFAAWKEGR